MYNDFKGKANEVVIQLFCNGKIYIYRFSETTQCLKCIAVFFLYRKRGIREAVLSSEHVKNNAQ